MRRPRYEPPQLAERLQEEFRFKLPLKLGTLGSIVVLLWTVGAGVLDVYSNYTGVRERSASQDLADKPLYEPPVIKGSRSTLGSLDPKHRDSLQDLEDVLRLRGKDPRDLETALSLVKRVIENERRTASDELLSHLYALQGDLLRREMKPAEASPILEEACKLNPGSWEMPFLLLDAYKAERYELEFSLTKENQESRIPRIQYLAKKIKELEEDLFPSLQSLLHLFEDSSVIELAAGGYSGPAGGGASIMAKCNGDVGLKFCLEGRPIMARAAGGVGIGCAFGRGCNVDVGPADERPTAGGVICNTGPHGCNLWGTYADHGRHTNALARWWTHAHGLPTHTFAANACRHTGAYVTRDGIDCTAAGLGLDGMTTVERNRVLAVGVNGGANAGFDRVTHAAVDAQRVSSALREVDFHSTVLVNQDATRPKILAELSHVVQTSRPGDVFVFYFSGHGFTDVNGHPVLVTGGGYPVKRDNAYNPVISAAGTVGLDGTVFTAGTDKSAGNNGNVNVLPLEQIVDVLSHHRGQAVVILDNCLNAMQLDTGTPRRLTAGPNRPTIILAGSPDGRVIESPRLGSGLFTYTLLRFLEQQRAADTERSFDIYEAFRFTAAETSRLARELYGMDQRPQLLRLK